MTRDDLERLRTLVAVASDASGWCPQCGPRLTPDEDGCCLDCGSTATGDGADQVIDVVRALPALLDAAERGLDDGLAFGPWNRLESSTPTRHAVAADGWPYSVGLMEDGRWYFHPASGDTGVRDTESEAIEAARAHDRARRAKGG